MTASSFEDERASAIAQGCDDFLRKPFREAEVLRLLHAHLGVRFVYADAEQRAAAASPAVDEAELTRESLLALPAALRDEFRQAVDRLDIKTTRRLIEQMQAEHGAIANALAKFLAEYRFDVLQTLFE